MALKFTDKPFTARGNQSDNVWNRFPEGTRPIASAPQDTASPVIVYTADGKGEWAMHYSGAWRKLAPFKDFRDGSISWRMNGEQISNPVAWGMPRKK